MLYDNELRRQLCRERAEELAQEARRGPPRPERPRERGRRRQGLGARLAQLQRRAPAYRA